MYLMAYSCKHLRDEEDYRLFEVYEASCAKEHAAAANLLVQHHSLSNPSYVMLLDDLRAIRTKCNADMLAIVAHHDKKMRDLITVH
jgi:hypothetical protein